MASKNNEISYQSQEQDLKTSFNIFSVRNIVILSVGLIFAVTCALTYAYQYQIFGTEEVFNSYDNDDSIVKNTSNLGVSEKQKLGPGLKTKAIENAHSDHESGIDDNENDTYEHALIDKSLISGSIILIKECEHKLRLFQLQTFSLNTLEKKDLTKPFISNIGIFSPILSLDCKNITFSSVTKLETISLDSINNDKSDNYKFINY